MTMRWLLVGLLSSLLVVSARAASLEVRLIRASNETEPTDPQLTKLEPKLKKVFGYLHYKQLGHQNTPLKDDGQIRLNLGEGIVVFVAPKATEKKSRVVDFEMYSGRAALVKSTVRLPPNHDVLITGPRVGDTLLVVTLCLVE